MQQSIKNYALILEEIVREHSGKPDFAHHVQAFLEWVHSRNDSKLLQKIYWMLERNVFRKYSIVPVEIEFAAESAENKKFIQQLEKQGKAAGIAYAVKTRIMPNLLGGVRVRFGDEYLMDVSMQGVLMQMFR